MSGGTSLVAHPISAVDEANRVFGGKVHNSIPLVLLPGRSCCKPYIRIPEGVYALVQKHGANLDCEIDGKKSAVWPSGLHQAWPWVKVSHLVTKQAIVFDSPVKGCKTADNVTVQIDTSIIFRIMGDPERGEDPELVRRFVFELGPKQLENHLQDAQEEAVRALARSVEHTEVYGLRSVEDYEDQTVLSQGNLEQDAGDEETKSDEPDAPTLEVIEDEVNVRRKGKDVCDAMKQSLNKQFNHYGVEISDVAITNVTLPGRFVNQMQEKTTCFSVIAEQKMKHENDMQMLKFNEELQTLRQLKSEEQEAEKERGRKLCAEIKKELDQVKADTEKIIAEIREKQAADVSEIQAQAQLKVAQLDAEKNAVMQELNAKASAEAEALIAEKNAFEKKKLAESHLEVARNEAKAKIALAAAEGEAAPKLAVARKHEVMMQQMEVYKALARNKNVVISGDGNKNLLADMLVAQRQQSVLINVDPSRL
eukprot:TRINITY_DN2903_c0_g1_i1.p1 TRINITY_DN2903_c0_g1~~TRINITY_DN2903_c0_g1_i1.p1  ORF type:complete len:480 (-),score=177.58 TRINITY_DN2903_c0_g1_i1:245-1684(-)